MADVKKAPQYKSLAVIVAVASIAWFRERNRARPTGNYGNEREVTAIRDSLVERGWQMDDNGTLKVEEIPDDLRERALRERKERWDALKLAAKSDGSKVVDLSVFEEIYTDGKGNLHPVQFLGISGNRRSEIFFPAMVERKRLSTDADPRPVSKEVPVIIMKFDNPLDRYKAQVDENELKTLGFLDMSNVDRLLVAKEMYGFGATQSDLRRAFKDGMGQKLWGVIKLDVRFPTVRLIERMKLDPTDENFVDLAKIKFSDMPDFVLRSDPKELADKNMKLTQQGKEPLKPFTAEHLETYLKADSSGNLPKIMKRDNIVGLSNQFPALPLRAMAVAILSAKTDPLTPYQTAHVGLNAVDAIIKDGDFPPLETLLVRIQSEARGEARILLVRALMDFINGKK